MDCKDISDVVLVGGSSRIPKLRSVVEVAFGRKPSRVMNPDEAVACGAAILAAGHVNLIEITPLFLHVRRGNQRDLKTPGSLLPLEFRLPKASSYRFFDSNIEVYLVSDIWLLAS